MCIVESRLGGGVGWFSPTVWAVMRRWAVFLGLLSVLCLYELDPFSFALAPTSTRSSTKDSFEEGEKECRTKLVERKRFALDWDLRKLFRRKRRPRSAGGDSEEIDGVCGDGLCVCGRGSDTRRSYADDDGTSAAGGTGGLGCSSPEGDELRIDEQGLGVSGTGPRAIWKRVKRFFEGKNQRRRRRRRQINPARVEAATPVAAAAAEASPGEALAVEENTSEECRDDLETPSMVPQSEERRREVVEAVRWAWQGYLMHAWGMDELQPLTRKGTNSFGLGLMIVDSMDTLWLAGEKKEFARCLEWVEQSLDLDIDQSVNVFETTIRVLGGLLAAFNLSGEDVLLQKADNLGRRLAKAFESPSGIPYSDVNLKNGRAFNPRLWEGSSLAEATTLQLEFSYLTEVTGDPFFHHAAQRASDAIDAARLQLGWGYLDGGKKQGLAPAFVDPEKGLFGDSGGSVGRNGRLVTLGALADSYYEYLLKQWIFSGKTASKYLMRYQEAVRGMVGSLLGMSYPGGLWYVGELHGDTFSPKMDHLACFLPGTLALGHQEGAARGDDHLNLARQLMNTCYQMYEQTGTGLAPEIVHFNRNGSSVKGESDMFIKRRDRHNLLRPETLESLYYMYWITGEELYREQAWTIFKAFEQHCRVEWGGYAGLADVTNVRPTQMNKMETFFVSESLKYLLMIFSEKNPLPFDRYVFNTEAHAFPIP